MGAVKSHVREGVTFLVRGTDRGRPAWHYVRVERLKLPSFRRGLQLGRLDVAKYGKVLFSGRG